MIFAKRFLQKIIKEELSRLLELNKIPVLEGDAKSFDDPNQVLQAFAGKLAKRGYNVSDAKELGSGYNGIAFAYADPKRVLKITMDDTEALAANHLKGKKLQRVIPIYDVFQFPTKGKVWYGIIEAKAGKLSPQDKTHFDLYVRFILNNMNISIEQHIENSVWTMPWGEIKTRILENTKGDPEDFETAKTGFAFLEDLGFDKLLKELKDNAVEYFDVHGDNFMIYNGKFVLVDLGGNSRSPGLEPDLLERKK